MSNLKKLNDAHDLIQVMASVIIETQDALENLRDETETTLQLAGSYCLKAEKILEEMMKEISPEPPAQSSLGCVECKEFLELDDLVISKGKDGHSEEGFMCRDCLKLTGKEEFWI